MPPEGRRGRSSRRSRLLIAGICALGALACFAPGASAQVQLVPFGGQSFNSPFHVAAPPGDPDRVFVVEGPGTVRLVKGGVTQPAPFLAINGDVLDRSEGACECGMFSVAFAPDYASSGRFYVFYTRDVNPGFHHLRIDEFRRSAGNPDLADPSSQRIVLDIPHTTASNHNGGQLQFGPDGLLYVWVGDGGNTPHLAQDLSSLLGKILRVDPSGAADGEYSIPADNPFADGAGPDADEIYAFGLRNPYRGSFDRSTGDLTTGDVGGGQVEEVDYKPRGAGRGANFGWPCFEGTLAGPGGCTVPDHSPPVHQYPHGPGAAAISGGFVIRDSALPSLAGRYIYADTFAALGNQLRMLVPAVGSPSDAPLGISANGVTSFGEDACGRIYVATFAGQVARLQPASGTLPCNDAPVPTLGAPVPNLGGGTLELRLRAKPARRAAEKGAIVFRAACDKDCDISAAGLVRIAGRKRELRTDPDGGRALGGQELRLALDLSRGETKRLRSALRRGRRAKAKITVSATGGGGTDLERRKLKQKRPKPNQRR